MKNKKLNCNAKIGPNYKQIYEDIITMYPEKKVFCQDILSKENFSALDIIRLNAIIFSNSEIKEDISNGKHRSYDRASILQILDYQKKNCLTNLQLAAHFKISRNTVTKWKKLYYSLLK